MKEVYDKAGLPDFSFGTPIKGPSHRFFIIISRHHDTNKDTVTWNLDSDERKNFKGRDCFLFLTLIWKNSCMMDCLKYWWLTQYSSVWFYWSEDILWCLTLYILSFVCIILSPVSKVISDDSINSFTLFYNGYTLLLVLLLLLLVHLYNRYCLSYQPFFLCHPIYVDFYLIILYSGITPKYFLLFFLFSFFYTFFSIFFTYHIHFYGCGSSIFEIFLSFYFYFFL